MHPGAINDRLSGDIIMRSNIDPVVEEIRDTRRKLLKECDNDPRKYGNLIAAAAKQRNRLVKKKSSVRQSGKEAC
jgi:hypothetical protein